MLAKRVKTNYILAIFLPFIVFIGIETGMIVSYGRPSYEPDPADFEYTYKDIYENFFQKVYEEGKEIYYPKRLRNVAREFSVEKESNTMRIFILGGSVARNWEEDTVKPLTYFLKPWFPGKRFEVINCGMGGYDSYRVYLVSKEVLSYQPDFLIILSGNNEYYDPIKVNLGLYRVNKFLRNFWVYRKLQDHFLVYWKNSGLGIDFKKHRTNEERLADYQKNIRNIVQEARAKKVPVILATLPVNFRDSPPRGEEIDNYSLELYYDFILAKFLFENQKYSLAEIAFEVFLKNNPGSALGYYFLARTHDKMKNYQKAKNNYLKALELAYCDTRAIPASNEIIRLFGHEEGINIADIEKRFLAIVPYGLLGRESFFDYCHWWDEGFYLVAEAVVAEILKIKGLEVPDYFYDFFSKSFLSLEEYGKNPDHIKRQILIAVWEIFGHNNLARNETAIAYLKTLYLMDPDSLWAIKDLKKEIKSHLKEHIWTKKFISSDKYPFEARWFFVLYHIGETYRRLGLYQQSLEYFSNAVALDENHYLPYLKKALVYYKLENNEKFLNCINKSKKLAKGSKKYSEEVSFYKSLLKR